MEIIDLLLILSLVVDVVVQGDLYLKWRKMRKKRDLVRYSTFLEGVYCLSAQFFLALLWTLPVVILFVVLPYQGSILTLLAAMTEAYVVVYLISSVVTTIIYGDFLFLDRNTLIGIGMLDIGIGKKGRRTETLYLW